MTQGLSDDGGTVIAPGSNTYSGMGRWVNLSVQAKPTKLNVLQYGAYCLANIYSPPTTNFDSLDAVDRAIAALPNADYLPVEPPGAGGTGHIKKGIIYFPGAGQNSGYLVSDEINGSPELGFQGDGSNLTLLAFASSSAPSATNEKFIIHYRYGSNTVGNADTTFNTRVVGLSLDALDTSGNPGGSGILFLGCNGGIMQDVNVSATLEAFVVVAKGVTLDNLITGAVNRGPGLTLTGDEITGGYWDIEHVNPSNGTNGGVLWPAVWFSGVNSASVQSIATENTALSVRITNSLHVIIDDIHAHIEATSSIPSVPGSGLALIDGNCDEISLVSLDGAYLPFIVKDISSGVIAGGAATRNYTYAPPAGQGSYYQDFNAYALYNSGSSGDVGSSGGPGNTYLGYTSISSLLGPLTWASPVNALTTATTLASALRGSTNVVVASGTTAMVPNHVYIVNLGSAASLTLPNGAAGDTLEVVGAAGGWQITQGAGEFIGGFNGTNAPQNTTLGTSGYLASVYNCACVRLVCLGGGGWIMTSQAAPGCVSFH